MVRVTRNHLEPLDAVGTPALRDALLYVRGRPDPVSAEELAAAQGVHPNVARSRLDRLVDAGLLLSHFERRTGRSGPGAGRPAKIYSPAPETTAVEFPDRNYAELVALLVDELPSRARAKHLREVGAAFAHRLLHRAPVKPVRDLRRGLERVCGALGELGFQATVEEVDGQRAVLSTPTCPLRPLVVAHPELVEIDRGMWCGLVEAGVAGACAETVACETRDCFDDHASCRIVVELARRRSG
jgi:predicted ArsR family transcriptional regulator